MRVLVTGSAGFVGRHLMAAFKARGDNVFGIDVVDAPDDDRTMVSDALNYFRRPWSGPGFDLAVHCAATIGGRAGIDGSPLAVATNLALDAWFFRWLELAGVPRAVYFSSSAAYPVSLQTGRFPQRELREEDIDLDALELGRPDATYGWAKLTGEMLAAATRARGQHVLTVRPFSGYGPGQTEDYPFPALIGRAVRRESPFDVWGMRHVRRDWVHISDVVGAVLALLDAGEQGPVNIGTGIGTSFMELAVRMRAATRTTVEEDPPIRFLNDKPAGVAHRVADISRLSRFYTPKVSLEEGIAEAVTNARAAARA